MRVLRSRYLIRVIASSVTQEYSTVAAANGSNDWKLYSSICRAVTVNSITPNVNARDEFLNTPRKSFVSDGMTVRKPIGNSTSVSYTHLRAHETVLDLVC